MKLVKFKVHLENPSKSVNLSTLTFHFAAENCNLFH